MRWRLPRRGWKYFAVALILNMAILFILSWWQSSVTSRKTYVLPSTDEPSTKKYRTWTKPFLTIIYQDFDESDNHIEALVRGISVNVSTEVNILVISDHHPYPPIHLPQSDNIHMVVKKPALHQYLNATRPDSYIDTEYVLFLPDGVTISKTMVKSLRDFVSNPDHSDDESHFFAISVGGSKLECHGLIYNKKLWTLDIGPPLKLRSRCGHISGEHGIFTRRENLVFLPNPFLPPTFTSLYLQFPSTMRASIIDDVYLPVYKPLYTDPQIWWNHKQLVKDRLHNLYSTFGIKKVVYAGGQTDWYGCTKESQRCFGTIHNDMPDFLYQGHWTPPCCMKALRETAKHVFNILDRSKVRYWLEGGSLLGAARLKDIIPWDYDIDVGIYAEDVIKCTQLAKIVEDGPFVDENGFVWMKATEGEFYRVQYSETNHLHVDIFPFFSKNGTMTKNTWFKTHKQDTEFPESFLKPLTKIEFAGLNPSAPNNVKRFLEYKFGKGVIQNPKYPNNAQPN